MRKRRSKFYLFLLSLTALLAFVLSACTDGATGSGGGVIDVPKQHANFEEALIGVQNTLSDTRKKAEKTEIYSVDSKYSFDLASYTDAISPFQYTITLNANFNEKNNADSTIYFKLFDDVLNKNRIMTYFTEGTLYLDILGERTTYEGFGASSMFRIFYDAVRGMDLSRIITTNEMIETIGDIVVLKPYIDEKNVQDRKVGENGKYYEFKQINLDAVKSRPNELLKGFLAPIGDKLDALTEPLLGIKTSRIANVQIGTWNADEISFASDNGILKNFGFEFSGALDSRENYELTGRCDVGWTEREIKVDEDDDPFRRSDQSGLPAPVYQDGELGNYAFRGTLTLSGMASVEYDVAMQLKTDDNGNLGNKMSILLKNSGTSSVASSVYYQNGILYADLGEIMTVLGNGFGLKEMGFPKVKTDKFNMSQSFGSLLAELERLVAELKESGGDVDDSARDLILKKLSSDKEGYLNLLVDKELVTYFAGGEENVVMWLSTELGIDEETAERYFSSEVFDRIYLLVRLNLSTKNLIFVLNDGTRDVLTLSLFPDGFDEALLDQNLAAATGGFSTYNDFVTPENVGVTMEGTISVTTEADFSRFFGAFIGDAFGKNTPVVLSSTALRFRVEALSRFDRSYQAHAKIWRLQETDENTYLELWATEENGIPMLFVDYKMLGFRYRIPAEEVRRALALALGEDNILVTGDLIEIFSRVLSVANVRLEEEDVSVTILQTSTDDDPMFDILNVRGLTAEAKAAVRYSFEDVSFEPSGKDQYGIPTLATLPQREYDSLYEAEWIEKIEVGEFGTELFIPYDPDSVRVVDGKTVYTPTGKLFGQEIRYYLTVTGGIDGTKEVVGIKNDSLTIDPWAKVPLKDKLDVLYREGEGKLPYVIEGFNESLINPLGLDRTTYIVRFGTETSILHKTIPISIEVEVRTLDPKYSSENDQTIIGTVEVNPIEFFESPYEALPKTVALDFMDMRPGATYGATFRENFEFVWEYDYTVGLTAEGSSTIVPLSSFRKEGSAEGEEYNRKPMAYRVVVQPKRYDHIEISTEKGKNVYTVDVLTEASYQIPAISTTEREVRLYFKDGTYATVGDRSLNFEYDKNRNGYLPAPIDWLYKSATDVKAGGSSKPLDKKTATDTAIYRLRAEFNGAVVDVAEMRLTLEVQEPAAAAVREGATTGVIANTEPSNGVVIRTNGNFDYHAVNLGYGYGVPFRFNPYAPQNLPASVGIRINTATKYGETNIVERTYPVRWSSASNVVSDDGKILYPSAKDMSFQVIGEIGDGKVNIEFSAVVSNEEAKYRSVEYLRKDSLGNFLPMGEKLTVNAYEPYLLPNFLKLTLENNTVVEIDNAAWTFASDGSIVKPWSEARYNEYIRYLQTGEGNFDILEYYRNPDPNDGVGFRFDNQSRIYDLVVSVSNAEIHIYENEIAYSIGVTLAEGGIVRVPYGETDDGITRINPYSPDSASLVSLLTSGSPRVAPVRFADNSAASYLPVVWDASSLNILLDRLKSGGNSAEVTIEGTVFSGFDGMAEHVTGTFSVLDRTVAADGDGIGFEALRMLGAEDASYAIALVDGEKTLNLELKRPYALFTKGGVPGTPSEFLRRVLGSVSLVFPGGSTGRYTTKIDFLGFTDAEFDAKVLDFENNAGGTEATFRVRFTEIGSTEDSVTVRLITARDVVTETGVTVYLDRFQTDGSPSYPDGYAFGDKVTVNFSASGAIPLTVETWTVNRAPINANISAGQKLWSLPAVEFASFESRAYDIISSLQIGAATVGGTLRNTVEISYHFEIHSTDVLETKYSGTSEYVHNGAPYRLSIENGLITFDTVFDFYGLLTDGAYDAAKLPIEIAPNRSSSYQQDNVFPVVWETETIPENFELFYTENGALAATAKVKGYGASEQTVKLCVRILKKNAVGVRKDGFDFSTAEGGGIVLTLDPYAVRDGYAMWETTLPSIVEVLMAESGNVKDSPSSVRYRAAGGADADPRLYYDFKAFEATGTETLDLEMVLEDGSVLPLTVKLRNRVVESALFPYGKRDGSVGESENVLFVDPYDTAFAGLPETAKIRFADGSAEKLSVDLAPLGAEFVKSCSGGVYDYRFHFYGYRYNADGIPERVNAAQNVDVTVVVAPRLLKQSVKESLQKDVVIDDGIAAMLSDFTIGKGLTEDDFKAVDPSFLPAGVAIPADMSFETPSIEAWQKPEGSDLTDNDFIPGANYILTGTLGGEAAGELLRVNLRLKEMRYEELGYRDASGNFISTESVEYDVFNAKSFRKSYTLKFTLVDPSDPDGGSETLLIDFSADAEEAARRRIWWSESIKNAIGTSFGPGQSSVAETFVYGNPSKSARYDGDTRTFRLIQIEDLRAELGYNGGTGGASQSAVYVYDPLNPSFPTTVRLFGTVNGAPVDLGEHNIIWNGFTPDGTFGKRSEQVRVTFQSSVTNYTIDHFVEVLTLDRTAFTLYANGVDITNGVKLDPAQESVYDAEKNEYILPREINLTFSGSGAVWREEYKTALDNYGANYRVANARWWLGKVDAGGIRKISLDGNEDNPWPMVLVSGDFTRSDGMGSFTVGRDGRLPSTEDKSRNPFGTRLTVLNRSVQRTSVTGEKTDGIFRAEQTYALDPYNVEETLPTSVQVWLGGEKREFFSPRWTQIGEIRTEVIEGTASEDKSYVSVELGIYADKIVVNFPVKSRPLASEGMIEGGTFYVDYGAGDRAKIAAQLPQKLYFNFGYRSGSSDYTSASLSFNASDIPVGAKLAPGISFEMNGTFGVSLTGKPNFHCTIVPVSPRLYALAEIRETDGVLTDYRKLDFYYDTVSVPVGSDGRILGATEVKNALPSYLWLGKGLNPAKIVSKDFLYDEQTNEATGIRLTASYSFRATDAVNPNLAVNKDGSTNFAIEYTLPLSKYDVSKLLGQTPELDPTGLNDDGFYHFGLGNAIVSSNAPTARYDGTSYGIYWDFSAVNINRSGDYSAEGKLILSDDSYRTFSIGVHIDPVALQSRDVYIDSGELKYTYSGTEKTFYVQLSDIVKENGTIGKPHYTLLFAKAGSTDFIRQQYLDAGSYVVRVMIDDQNAVGHRDFAFEIEKWRVSDIAWDTKNNFTFAEGTPRTPDVLNLPGWVKSELTYREIDSDGTMHAIPGAPIDAGRYIVALSIPDQDNCEASPEALPPMEFRIDPKSPDYRVITELFYNGSFRHAEIEGLPGNLADGMSVSYEYSLFVASGGIGSYVPIGSDRIRNAGKYMVIVNIDGGRNYASMRDLNGTFEIKKAKLTVTLSDVESYYLQSLLPFGAGTLYSSPFGTDTLQNFTPLQLTSEVTERSVPGRYPFSVGEGSLIYSYNGTVYDNYEIEYAGLDAAAYVVKMNEGVKLIRNSDELTAALASLKRGDSVSYYLEAGDYGKVELSTVADVTLTGCYGAGGALAVKFDSLKIVKGTAKLNLIAFRPEKSFVSVYVGSGASAVTIADSVFRSDAAGVPPDSTAIYTERGFAGTITLNRVTIEGYAVGASLEGGDLSMTDSSASACRYGVITQNGKVTVARSLFERNTVTGLVVNGASGAVSVMGSRFAYNAAAVIYTRPLTAAELEELIETGDNVYSVNGRDVVPG